jgi:hypothetical protein
MANRSNYHGGGLGLMREITKWDRTGNSDLAMSCFCKENMNTYKENKKRKDCTNIQFCAIFVFFAKTVQNYFLCKAAEESLNFNILLLKTKET